MSDEVSEQEALYEIMALASYLTPHSIWRNRIEIEASTRIRALRMVEEGTAIHADNA